MHNDTHENTGAHETPAPDTHDARSLSTSFDDVTGAEAKSFEVFYDDAKPHSVMRFATFATSSVVMIAMVFGLLIWAKLRLVSGMPRSVYADPKSEVQKSEPPALPDLILVTPGSPMPMGRGAPVAPVAPKKLVRTTPAGGYD